MNLSEGKERFVEDCSGSAIPRIRIYQHFFRDEQVAALDPSFVPHDGRENPFPQYYETFWLVKFWKSGGHRTADYNGIVSWKFFKKTRIQGLKFIQFIRRNPGYDVYFINPFPHEVYLFYNVWTQAEAVHPGITNLAQDLLDVVGQNIRISELGRNDHRTALYCNYWVGNCNFWETYMQLVAPLFDYITDLIPTYQRAKYFALTKYAEEAPIFPFIFERFFSTLLLTREDIRACHYRLSSKETRRIYTRNVGPNYWAMVKHKVKTIDEWDSCRDALQDLVSQRSEFEKFWNDSAQRQFPARSLFSWQKYRHWLKRLRLTFRMILKQ